MILRTDTPALFDEAVLSAAALLRKGEVVALPTETVYGLAANALNAEAVKRIYEVKGRPAHNPTIVHVASLEMAKPCVADWPEIATRLAQAFWPGPLTLVLPKAASIPNIVTSGGPTVGVRWPSHPFIQAVIRACGFPLAAPSANPSNRVSPTTAAHVEAYFGRKLPLVVDGGQCHVGIESAVLDLCATPPRVLRPGMISSQSLAAVLGDLDAQHPTKTGGVLRSPGLLKKHYSPKAKLVVCGWTTDAELLENYRKTLATSRKDQHQWRVHVIAHTHIPEPAEYARVAIIPRDPQAFARALYSELHLCDAAGADLILLEQLPEGAEWRAIADRVCRAAQPD